MTSQENHNHDQPESTSVSSEEMPAKETGPTVEELQASLFIKDRMIEGLREKVQGFEQKLVEIREFVKRQEAEVQAVRERAARDLEKNITLQLAKFLEPILSARDNLDRSLETMKESKDAFVEGIRLIRSQLDESLKSSGLERIISKGEIFDPNRHEAIGTIPVDSLEQEERIIEEARSGYSLKGQIIRPAQVLVGKKIGA